MLGLRSAARASTRVASKASLRGGMRLSPSLPAPTSAAPIVPTPTGGASASASASAAFGLTLSPLGMPVSTSSSRLPRSTAASVAPRTGLTPSLSAAIDAALAQSKLAPAASSSLPARRALSTAASSAPEAAPAAPSALQRLAKSFGMASPSQLVRDPAKTGFNRWLIVPAALGTHLSLGSIFAWSLFNQPLMTLHGVVAPAAADWELGSIMPVFSTTMACFGLSSFLLGRAGVYEKLGPRVTGVVGGSLFASAFAFASLAAQAHSLPVLFAGYGALAGLAVGTAYVPPISTLLKWFPDRKGVAAAMAVMGFGAGGMVAAPIIETLLAKFRKIPTYIGAAGDVPTVSRDGRLYVDLASLPADLAAAASNAPASTAAGLGSTLREVVVANTASIAKLGSEAAATLKEGLYLVGTGSTGLAETFACLGGIYATAILASAFVFRLPPEGFNPALAAAVTATTAHAPAAAAATTTAAAAAGTPAAPAAPAAPTAVVKAPYPHAIEPGSAVTPAETLKTRQFWLVWAGMCFNSTAAYALIGAGKTMLTDIFGGAYPAVVTSAFAATFVSMLSAFNLGGRLGWGSIADAVGTKKTFMWLWGLGVPLYLAMPFSAHLVQDMLPAVAALTDASSLADKATAYAPLGLFYASVMVAISTFGGSAAVSPAYMADLFGSKYVGAIHGQLLSFLVVSGYLGPVTCTTLREMSFKKAVEKLTALVDPAAFEAAFGAPPTQLQQLIDAKTVTIPRLMELVPAGTVDPTPFLYDETLMAMSALQVIALAAALTVTKVNPKHYEAALAAAKAAVAKAAATPNAAAAVAATAAAAKVAGAGKAAVADK